MSKAKTQHCRSLPLPWGGGGGGKIHVFQTMFRKNYSGKIIFWKMRGGITQVPHASAKGEFKVNLFLKKCAAMLKKALPEEELSH